jgi:hypothetical protein
MSENEIQMTEPLGFVDRKLDERIFLGCIFENEMFD